MSYPEADLIPISSLQHLLFCERQAALIHVERLWAENRWTAEGRQLHQKTHSEAAERRGRVRIVRGLQLRSLELGLFGRADVVEFEPPETVANADGLLAMLRRGERPSDWSGWRITPVEYKRGRPKANDCDRVQLCAQTLCLEEMLGLTIAVGLLFYGQQRRRKEVTFGDDLRRLTARCTERMRELIETGTTPPAIREPKCDRCSLYDLCLPDATTGRRRVGQFRDRQFETNLASAGPAAD